MSAQALAYYAHLRALRATVKPRIWTRETTLQAVHYWASDEGRLPTYDDCNAREGLPSYMSITALWGTLTHYLEAYTAQRDSLTATAPPDVHGTVTCLRCDRHWHSPDRKRCRICPTCTSHATEEDGDVSWMNADVTSLRPWTTGRTRPHADDD